MPKAFPNEFREGVIRVFKESDASVAQVAKDFGISPSCLKRDDRRAAHHQHVHPGKERERVRGASGGEQADQAARAGERGPALRGRLSLPGAPCGKMMYPLVRELAGDGVPVTTRVKDLEVAWDNGEAAMKPASPDDWHTMDSAIDGVLTALHATTPTKGTCVAALANLQSTIGALEKKQ